MNGYVSNIEKLALENDYFRKVLYTSTNSQLVLMSLRTTEDIGEEVHETSDQFLRVEHGTGTAILNGVTHNLSSGSALLVPAGVRHTIVNTGEDAMKLYTLYTPPHHCDGVVHTTKVEAETDAEHFDGTTTES